MSEIVGAITDAINGTVTSNGVQQAIAAKKAEIVTVTNKIPDISNDGEMSETEKVNAVAKLNVTLTTLELELNDLQKKLSEKLEEEKKSDEGKKIAATAKEVGDAAENGAKAALTAIDCTGGKRKSKRRSNKKKRNSKKKKGGKRKSSGKRK